MKNRHDRIKRVVFRRGFYFVLAILLFLLWSTGCMETLFYHPTAGTTYPPTSLRNVESITFNSGDGTKLHGWFIPAQNQTPISEAPTILHVHGNAGNIESHIWFTQYLPQAGFNLFIFDFRGYGQSEGSSRSRKPLIEDTIAALDSLLARQDIDKSRIGMYAQSLGGAIGINVMAQKPEIKAAILESSFASWREIAANAVGGDPPNILARGLSRLLIKDSHRPVDAIRKIKRPILIFHGTADSIIPISHGRKLAIAGPMAELVEFDGGEHNSLRATHMELEPLAIDFFNKHLRGERVK